MAKIIDIQAERCTLALLNDSELAETIADADDMAHHHRVTSEWYAKQAAVARQDQRRRDGQSWQ